MSRRTLRATVGCALMTVFLTGCTNVTAGQAVDGQPRGTRHGADPGEGISVASAVLLYAVVPAVILLVIAALAWLPGVVRGSRYRPQQGWSATPVWFSGPPEPVAAVEQAETGDLVRGGASGSW